MVETTGGMTTISGQSVLVTPSGQIVGSAYRGGGGGRRRRGGDQLGLSEEEARRRDAEERARLEAERKARAEAERKRQERIEAGRTTGQLSGTSSSNLTRRPTAREELLQMSIPDASTRTGRFVRNIETRGSFIQGRTEFNLLSQRREFESLNEGQLMDRAGREGTGITGMSTEQGRVFSLSFDEGRARREARSQFASLPVGDRLRLTATGLGVGVARNVFIDAPKLFIGSGGVGTQDSTGRITFQNTGRAEWVRELESRPSGPSEIAGRVAIPGSLAVTGAVGLGGRIATGIRTGTGLRGIGSEIATGFSPIRPAQNVWRSSGTTSVSDIRRIDLGNGRFVQGSVSRSADGGRRVEQFVSVRPSARDADTNIVRGFGVERTNIATFRGGRLEFGQDTNIFSISGRPSGSISSRPVVSGLGFGPRIEAGRISGQVRDLGRIRETESDITVFRGSGLATPFRTGLMGEQRLVSSSREFRGASINTETGRIFGSSRPNILRGRGSANIEGDTLFPADTFGRVTTTRISGLNRGDRGFTNLGRGGTGRSSSIVEQSTSSSVIPTIDSSSAISSARGIRSSFANRFRTRTDFSTTRQTTRTLTSERLSSRSFLGLSSGLSFRSLQNQRGAFTPLFQTRFNQRLGTGTAFATPTRLSTPTRLTTGQGFTTPTPTTRTPPTRFTTPRFIPPPINLGRLLSGGRRRARTSLPSDRYSPDLASVVFRRRGRRPTKTSFGINPFVQRPI